MEGDRPRQSVDLLEQLRARPPVAPTKLRRHWSKREGVTAAAAILAVLLTGALFYVAEHRGRDRQPPRAVAAVSPSTKIRFASVPIRSPFVAAVRPAAPTSLPPPIIAPANLADEQAHSAPVNVQRRRAVAVAVAVAGQRPKLLAGRVRGAGAPIEPYRNGRPAQRVTGEALRLALVEDSRITRQLNEASLDAARQGRPPATR